MPTYRPVMDFVDCAKPLMFENDDGAYPYSMHGTCFLVRVHGLPYMVMARHCLVGRSIGSLRIRVRPGILEFVRLRGVRYPAGDGDSADLAVFEIKRDSVSEADLN